jgi:hypothetical protein
MGEVIPSVVEKAQRIHHVQPLIIVNGKEMFASWPDFWSIKRTLIFIKS